MTATHRPLAASGTAAEALPCEAPCAPRSRPYVLFATIIASAMAFIDGTLVHVALPAIQTSLGARFADLQWVVNGYTLMLAALLLAGGALGDQTGRRRVFIAGIVVFTLASIGCALAIDARMLIVARVVQGLGAALMVPQSLAIIAASFPRTVRGRAIGTWAAFSALTTAAGPAVGGLLIDLVSWRAAFWINVPLGVLAIALTLRHVPESRNRVREPVDWAGAATATLALGAMAWAMTLWPRAADVGYLPIGLAALLGLAAAVAFVAIERHVRAPMVPPEMFRIHGFVGLNMMTLLLYAALGGTVFLVPYNLIQVQGYSALQAGLATLPIGLLIGVLSRHAGAFADRRGVRMPLVGGPLLVAAGCAGLAVPGVGGGYFATFFLPITLLALGLAITVSPLTTAVMNTAPDDRTGAASGINNTAARVAGLFAVALGGALASAVFAVALETRLAELAVADDVRRMLLADADRLAELAVPLALAPGLREAIEAAIEQAFIQAFRVVILLNAGFAVVAALIAARVLAPPRVGEAAATEA